MDELNNNQLILLALLVSFVTSIATGIVTVTLLNQAPVAVTQTINRVVERTIEKAVPGETKTSTVIKEVPVIVTEEQLIVDAINGAAPAMLRLSEAGLNQSLGSGFLVSSSGLVASASELFPATGLTPGRSYDVYLNNGKKVSASVVGTNLKRGVSLLQLNPTEWRAALAVAGQNATTTPTIAFSRAEVLPGQTVVALGLPDSGTINVSGGIVSGVLNDAETATASIRTGAASAINLGGPLLNTKGQVIGLNDKVGSALTVQMIKDTIASVINN